MEKSKKVTLTITIPYELLNLIDSKKGYINRSNFICQTLANASKKENE